MKYREATTVRIEPTYKRRYTPPRGIYYCNLDDSELLLFIDQMAQTWDVPFEAAYNRVVHDGVRRIMRDMELAENYRKL